MSLDFDVDKYDEVNSLSELDVEVKKNTLFFKNYFKDVTLENVLMSDFEKKAELIVLFFILIGILLSAIFGYSFGFYNYITVIIFSFLLIIAPMFILYLLLSSFLSTLEYRKNREYKVKKKLSLCLKNSFLKNIKRCKDFKGVNPNIVLESALKNNNVILFNQEKWDLAYEISPKNVIENYIFFMWEDFANSPYMSQGFNGFFQIPYTTSNNPIRDFKKRIRKINAFEDSRKALKGE